MWLAWAVAYEWDRPIQTAFAKRFPTDPAYEPVAAVMARDPEPEVRKRVARHVIFEEVLHDLAGDEDHLVRMWVARNTATRIDTLWRLARDEHESVRYALAGSAAAVGTILDDLAGDVSDRVRVAVAENPNTREQTLQHLRLTDAWEFVHEALNIRGFPSRTDLEANPIPPRPLPKKSLGPRDGGAEPTPGGHGPT